MAYDEGLADRIRALLATDHDVVEKKMFGGLAFLVGGHMSVSASRQGGLLLRASPTRPTRWSASRAQPVRDAGRAMDGWLRVEADAVESAEGLERWVAVGVGYAHSLPPK